MVSGRLYSNETATLAGRAALPAGISAPLRFITGCQADPCFPMPALLVELWREQHPHGHEQTFLNFAPVPKPLARVPLFPLEVQTRPASSA